MSLLSSTETYESVLKKPDLTIEQRNKIELARKVLDFAKNELKLNSEGNYSKIVMLDRPYVTYVVSAAEAWKLEPYQWSFPIVGKVPYLGFFNQQEALDQEQELKNKGYDTYMRGVSAYSTLGWFKDPLLSSMLRYDDHVLVETLIHELVHTTFWVKDHVEFNERLATFLGRKGTELFYQSDQNINTVMNNEIADEILFSKFITDEVQQLSHWYQSLPESQQRIEIKEARIKEIQTKFQTQIIPKMKTDSYQKFADLKLNNARLVMYRTYLKDDGDFERLWAKSGQNFAKFIELCQPLENSKNPDESLTKLLVDNTK